MDALSITEKNGANYILYELAGAITTYTSAELQEKAFEQIKRTNLVFDLSDVEEIDSVGVGLVMATFNDAEDAGRKLYLMNPSPAVRQAIEDTGFYNIFHFIHSVTEMI
ncbi:MAG: STAS domain-containing protein [Treponema sp.]|nr:STAS domain-containing protein [Candidatus Treponema equifaecale]